MTGTSTCARNFVGLVEEPSVREVKLPSAMIVTWNADLRTASTIIKSVKPSEKRRFPHPAAPITNAKPVRPSYRPPRGARMITAAGNLNADPAMSTT